MAPFMVRGNCETLPETNTVVCEELGFVHANFDPGTGTITIPVPLALINAKKKSVIKAGESSFSTNANTGGPVIAIPAAFFALTGFPNDVLQMTKTFKVPRKL